MSIDLNAIQARADVVRRCYRAAPNDCYDMSDIDKAVEAQLADVPALLAYARDLEARLKEATVSALREAADDMDEVIARGDVAEVAAPVEGSVGRPEAISSRDSLYEEPSHWLRGYADALEDETIRAALTATEGA